MTNNTAQNYLHDLVQLVKEQALAARAERDAAAEGDREYATGRLMAYHEVMSLMQQQAVAFGMDLGGLGLDGISPERDLT